VWQDWVNAGKPADGKLAMLRKRREWLDEDKPKWEHDTIVRKSGELDDVIRLTPGSLHMEGVPTCQS
jgi:hypothetical protein